MRAHLAALAPRIPRLRDERLRRLAEASLDGVPVLRLSPRRLVWRASDPRDGAPWACKLDRPGRVLDPLRSRLRLGALAREGRAWRALAAAGAPVPGTVLVEELGAGDALLARPWIAGTPLDRALPEEAAAVGAGLAGLHARGWTDRDLLPRDLLWTGSAVVPVDLGAARVHRRPAGARTRWRDLTLLLAGLSPDQARASAERLLETYGEASGPAVPRVLAPESAETLLAAAARRRARGQRRRSRRCLRTNADFRRAADGSVTRRDAPPASGAMRTRLLPLPRARALFRRLYERELRGEPAPRPWVLERRGAHALVSVVRLEGAAQAHLREELGEQGEDDAHDQPADRREGDDAR